MNLGRIIAKYIKKYYGVNLEKEINKKSSSLRIKKILEKYDFTMEYYLLDRDIVNKQVFWSKIPDRFITSITNDNGVEKECIASIFNEKIRVEFNYRYKYYKKEDFIKVWSNKILKLNTNREEKHKYSFFLSEKIYFSIIIVVVISLVFFYKDFVFFPLMLIQLIVFQDLLRRESNLYNKKELCYFSQNSCKNLRNFYINAKCTIR